MVIPTFRFLAQIDSFSRMTLANVNNDIGQCKQCKFSFQVAFEYSASQLEIIESFWTFSIPEQNITIPFLLVGKAREPDITMDRSHMNFKALLIGKVIHKKNKWFVICY